MSETFEKESRKAWTRVGEPSVEDLLLGCLQRIATATETMAQHNDRLICERDSARASRDYWRSEAEAAWRRLSAAKGQITRLKRKQGGRDHE